MADVAVVIGHHPDAKGASLELGGHEISEYDFWKPWGHELAASLHQQGLHAVTVERPHEEPDQALAERVNATEAAAAIELHFNAAEPGADGTEMLHWPSSSRGSTLAARLQHETVKALKTRDRGIQARDDLAFLKLTEMPAVICEPAFGSDEGDAWRLLTRQVRLMEAYRTALTSFCLDKTGVGA
mgnify:CR=1 FL=1